MNFKHGNIHDNGFLIYRPLVEYPRNRRFRDIPTLSRASSNSKISGYTDFGRASSKSKISGHVDD
jgi:hypothetical protein